jgi:hypothetical protein
VVEPGPIEVRATADGMQPFEESVSLGAGETRTIAIALEPVSGGEEEEPDSGPGLGLVRIIGIAVAGAGVASLVVFGVTGSIASSKFSEVEECGGPCPAGDKYEGLIDSGKTMQTVANVMLGVGLALSVGGAAMIVFGGPSDDAATNGDDDVDSALDSLGVESLRIGAAPLPGGAAFGLSGSF